MNARRVLIVALAIVVGAIAFDRSRADDAARGATSMPTPTTLPSVEVTLGTQRFTLEIADDADEQETGLMHRRAMPADHGMIFVFPWSDVRNFWMKNTLIPLDIVYLDDAARVLNVEPMVPLDLSSVRSDGRARYAIELNAGTAQRVGIKRGDRVTLPAEAR